MNCSSCGKASKGTLESIREEYKKLGFAFCESCVRSSKAYIWAEEEIERRGIRKMEKLALKVREEKASV